MLPQAGDSSARQSPGRVLAQNNPGSSVGFGVLAVPPPVFRPEAIQINSRAFRIVGERVSSKPFSFST
jgi:hypothetical protein